MLNQPFKNCKIICGNESCYSRGMCYSQMYILEKTEQKLGKRILVKEESK
jgi:hypothetical protein